VPRIFDSIQQSLLPALRQTILVSYRADFFVGYFNLRGWKNLQDQIARWSGDEDSCCRLLVGMQKLPQEELRELMSISPDTAEISNEVADRIRKRLAAEFREQLTIGIPTHALNAQTIPPHPAGKRNAPARHRLHRPGQ
jgi:hypothetical protein